MILTIDIGNTNINFGIFRKEKLSKRFNILTDEVKISGALPKRYVNILKSEQIDDAIICSVVPELVSRIKQSIVGMLSCSVKLVGKDIVVPIKNLYSNPSEVGQDRLVNAYAAKKLYSSPAIVIDFGTAITFDVININGEYGGGIIFPGLKISLDALVKKTSLLPNVNISKPRDFIGKDTVSSMQSGFYYGYKYFIEKMIYQLKKEINCKNTIVIGTGGDIVFLKPLLKKYVDIFDVNITLKGLELLKDYSNKEKN